MNLQGRVRNLPGSPTGVSAHTQAHTNPGLSQENRPPSTHCVCDTAAAANPVLRLGFFFVALFSAAGATELSQDEFTHLSPGRSRRSPSGQCRLPSPAVPYPDTCSQRRNPSLVPGKRRAVMLVPLALTHREMIGGERSGASLSPSGVAQHPPCHRPPARYTPGTQQSQAQGLSSQLSANKECGLNLS